MLLVGRAKHKCFSPHSHTEGVRDGLNSLQSHLKEMLMA